jgi:hypothetical protein
VVDISTTVNTGRCHVNHRLIRLRQT